MGGVGACRRGFYRRLLIHCACYHAFSARRWVALCHAWPTELVPISPEAMSYHLKRSLSKYGSTNCGVHAHGAGLDVSVSWVDSCK